MKKLRLFGWLRVLLRKRKLDSEMDEEMRAHIELRTQQNITAGMSADEARYAAQRQFGWTESIKETCRDQRRMNWIGNLAQDVRHGTRMLRKNLGFTTVAVLTLALGIGLNSSIFTLVNGVLLRPLPYPESDRLVQVLKDWKPSWRDTSELSADFEHKDLRAFLEAPNLPLEIAAYGGIEANLGGADQPERVSCGAVSSSLLPLLGMHPALGRNFLPDEDKPGADHVVILSRSLWQLRFGGDPQIIGRSIRLNERSYTVIGVLAVGAQLPGHFDLLLPETLSQEIAQPKHMLVWPQIIGRLRDGVSRKAAQRTLDQVYQSVSHPDDQGRIVITGFQERLVSRVRQGLLVFLGAVGMVLLIACVNVTNLVLARANSRQKEIGIRMALGSGRLRVLCQLLTESILISLLGGLLGLLFSIWSNRLLPAFSGRLPGLNPIGIDFRVLEFTFALTLMTGLLFGFASGFGIIRFSLPDSLQEAGRSITSGVAANRMRGLLVIFEVALAVVLLLGAGLLLKSFLRLQAIDPGFRPDRILTFTIDLSPPRYPDSRSQANFFERVIDRLQAIPGVETIAADATLPLTSWALSSTLEIEGRSLGENPIVYIGIVNADYFRTLGISLLQGRPLADTDRVGGAGVVVVNKSFVQRYFSDGEAIGKRIQTWGDEWKTIIGIVSDVRVVGLDQQPVPLVYHSYLQTGVGIMSFALKTATEPMKFANTVKSCVMTVDKDQPVFSLLTMEQRLADSLEPRRLNLFLLSIFSALAMGLAAIGIYGVISYLVAQRTHEIGVRIALGANRRMILGMVLKRGFLLVLPGIAVGLLIGIALTRVIASQLFAIPAAVPATFGAVSLVLIGAALIACGVPAYRATKIDPVVALRHE